jgi:tRNA1(Val) A37 N6-methylase TrmN6
MIGAFAAGPDETLDRLVGDWRILQRRRGHRFSTDDLVTAWRALAARPDAMELLDLGSGIGSVGLTALAHLPPTARLVGIEAQDESVALARRTAAGNGLADRVTFLHGDLRNHADLLDPERRFPLVTGSPPYVPPDRGVHSPVPQRAAARMELRGSVRDYCTAAAARLAPGGRFVFVMAAADPRAESAPVEAGLVVTDRTDIVFRAGRPPLVAVLTCSAQGDATARTSGCLVVRGADGAWTEDYLRFRAALAHPQG